MRLSFSTPILNADNFEGVHLKSWGNFAERYCAWCGNKAYSVLSVQDNAGKKKIELTEVAYSPHFSTAMKISRLTIVFPLIMLAIKIAYRLLNTFVLSSAVVIQDKILNTNQVAVEKLLAPPLTPVPPPAPPMMPPPPTPQAVRKDLNDYEERLKRCTEELKKLSEAQKLKLQELKDLKRELSDQHAQVEKTVNDLKNQSQILDQLKMMAEQVLKSTSGATIQPSQGG